MTRPEPRYSGVIHTRSGTIRIVRVGWRGNGWQYLIEVDDRDLHVSERELEYLIRERSR